MNVLICSAGRRVSLVRFFRQELSKIDGRAKVFTTDLNPLLSAACRVSDKAFQVGRFADSNYIEKLLAICLKNDVKLVVPTIDTELLLLSNVKEFFLSNGIHIIISDVDFISICRDKRKTNDFFISKGLKVPESIDPFKPVFPLFIKPYNGSSSKGIMLLKKQSMLSEEIKNNPDLMFMKYLPPSEFEEYTVDAYYDRDGRLQCVVPRLRLEIRAGEISKGLTKKNSIIAELKKKLGVLQGVQGCITFQFFKHRITDELYGIEINPRFGGGYPISYLAKANFIGWMLAEYLQNKTISWFDEWEDKLLSVRYDEEMIFRNVEL